MSLARGGSRLEYLDHNIGVVGYDVLRNGVRISQPLGTSYTDRPGRGTFTYQVRARDAVGNLSGLSSSVTVTT